LECKYIRKLQLEFERFRKNGESYPDQNPVDIVDPNRRKGLDREGHPFVKILFDWAEELLLKAVDQLREQERESKPKVANEDTNKRLRNLSKAVAQHLKERLEEESLMPKTQEQEDTLIREGVLLNPQFHRISVGEIRRMGYTVVSLGEAEDPGHVTIELEGEGLKITPVKPPLKPQRRNIDRLTAYFDVEGVTPTEKVTFTVRHRHELIAPLSRTLEVVEPEDQYTDRPDGIFFEKQNYTVHDNGTRTLTFIAKGKPFRVVNWASRDLVETTEPEAVVIMRGRELKVEKIDNDLWKGEVQVRGRGIGKRSRITLSIPTDDGLESTNANVEVVEKEPPPGVSIEIKVVSESMGLWRASWDRNNPNLLKVYAEHPTLSRYLGSEKEGYPGQKQAHFRILLAEIVAGKVVERILEQKMESNVTDFEEPKAYFFHQSEEMTSFLQIAHKIMISDGEAKMLIGKSVSEVD
jgi:dipeptidyl aminopeptidase/acylaminoacyl peptidase